MQKNWSQIHRAVKNFGIITVNIRHLANALYFALHHHHGLFKISLVSEMAQKQGFMVHRRLDFNGFWLDGRINRYFMLLTTI